MRSLDDAKLLIHNFLVTSLARVLNTAHGGCSKIFCFTATWFIVPNPRNSVVYANKLPLRNIACVTRLSRHKLRDGKPCWEKINRDYRRIPRWTFFWSVHLSIRFFFLLTPWQKKIIWFIFVSFFTKYFRQSPKIGP